MAPSHTSTVKSKHAANKSGIRNSKNSTRPQGDGVSKSRSKKATTSKGAPPTKLQGNKLATLKKKRRVYTEKELGIPALNMITPVGVEKPKGKKKGKVFVDDRVSANLCRRLDLEDTVGRGKFIERGLGCRLVKAQMLINGV
jgi:60S ribosomal subunit assembly/export protein LOC1